MKFFHSIRWRLQLWHGLLLVLVLAGFGFTACQLQWATQLQRIDQELEQRVPVIVDAMRLRGIKPPGPPPRDGFPPPPRDGFPPPRRNELSPDRNETSPPSPRELVLSAYDSSRFAGDPDVAFYYVVFVAEGTFCDFAKFRRLAFYGPTEFIASRWARHAV